MDRSAISSILRELNLNENSVANIYNHGSWVYGTNSPTSDRDLIIVTRSPYQNPLKFYDDFDYFHPFELHKLWNQYDVCVYSIENFEKLLEKNYLVVVQCIFLPDEFKIKEEIDFRLIYLEKYYNQFRLKQVAFYEMNRDFNLYESNNFSNHPKRSSRAIQTKQLRYDYIFKNLFHGLRYLDFAEQLIQTRSIHNFKRVTHIFEEMKDIRGNRTNNSSMKRVADFVRIKSVELKSRLDSLIPTNIIQGSFRAQITFDCSNNIEKIMKKLQKQCENTKYKILCIGLKEKGENEKNRQLMTSSYHCGEYPAIVKQIEEEVYKQFQDFNIIRIKIESLASNEGVPQTDIDKKLFWDKETNYFEFRYRILVRKNDEEQNLTKLRNICRSNRRFHLQISYNALKQPDETDSTYTVKMHLFDVGRENAFKNNDEVIEYLTKNNFPSLKVVREFIVYNTYINYDNVRQESIYL
ncbi:unnamed protein product [Rotaria sp. Silwood1]|nr:unnamed protein product [Rotaria sp. Silwood1]CAF4839385.1 unnamed protein product [Rotaria sp. Silwood1]